MLGQKVSINAEGVLGAKCERGEKVLNITHLQVAICTNQNCGVWRKDFLKMKLLEHQEECYLKAEETRDSQRI